MVKKNYDRFSFVTITLLIWVSIIVCTANTAYSKLAAILVFICLLANQPLLPRLKENILLNFEFKNEATRGYLHVNKRTLKWRPFWNKVYDFSSFRRRNVPGL